MTRLPKATVVRLPRYLRLLEDLSESRQTVSSSELADAAGAHAANARRDLSYLEFHGVRGVGYSVASLRDRIRMELGIDLRRTVAILGAGNLGTALANYRGFTRRGFDVAGVYDSDQGKVGVMIGQKAVRHIDGFAEDCARKPFDMAILAVPAGAAQQAADIIVRAGVSSILNFAPVRVEVPQHVWVRQVDLSMELQVLSYYGKAT